MSFNKEDVSRFFASINAISDKKGALLIQFPPSLNRECIDQLDQFLNCIKETNTLPAWKLAVEFRHKSWYHEKVYELLDAYGATIVIQDIPKSATPFLIHKTDFICIRFHGPTGNYRESYSRYFLDEYATYIKGWIDVGRTVYVYFNNTMGDALNNLKMLNSFIK